MCQCYPALIVDARHELTAPNISTRNAMSCHVQQFYWHRIALETPLNRLSAPWYECVGTALPCSIARMFQETSACLSCSSSCSRETASADFRHLISREAQKPASRLPWLPVAPKGMQRVGRKRGALGRPSTELSGLI